MGFKKQMDEFLYFGVSAQIEIVETKKFYYLKLNVCEKQQLKNAQITRDFLLVLHEHCLIMLELLHINLEW